MKKVLALLLAVLMLVCGTCQMVSAAALDVEDPDNLFNDEELDWGNQLGKFIVGDAEAVVGEEFTVPVSLDNNPGIISMKLAVSYDAAVLELVSATVGDFGSAEGEVPSLSFGPVENVPFTINWVDALGQNNKNNGTVANLTFRVKDAAAAGTTTVSVDYDPDDVFDYDLENVEFTCTNGTVTITVKEPDHIPGDVDGDGEVSMLDLVTIQRYLSGWDVEIDLSAADVDDDGEVSMLDLVTVQRYLSGWDVELL